MAKKTDLILDIHCVSEKVPTFKLSVTSSNLNHFLNFCTAGKRMKFATKLMRQYPSHLMWHYLGKLKIQFFCRCEKKYKFIAYLITSNFVIPPQISIFLVFKIARLFPYWLQIKISILLVYFCDQFVVPEICHSRRQCSVCQQSTRYSVTMTRFWQKVLFEGVHCKEVVRRISWEKLVKVWC